MVTFPTLQLIYASIVASQGIPRMRGYPLNFDFVCNTMESVGYYHDLIETITSSQNPSGFIVDLYAIWNIVGVCINNNLRSSLSMVSFVIALIIAPRYIRVFWIIFFFM
jgi:hypothetical protein